MPKYIEINCKSACNKVVSSFLPYHFDLNVYRGCFHKCEYCFAQYSHKYMNSTDFFDEIYIKKNIVEVLEKQLISKRRKREVINLGGVTDNYQPIEKEYKLMPDIIKLLIKYKIPAIISTKSNLILRDFDLFAELSKVASVNVATTITTVNEKVRELIEPNASTSMERLNILKEFSKTNVLTGIHIMPIIPEITDSYSNLTELFSNAKDCNVNYYITDILNLRGETKINFFKFIKGKLPHLYNKINSYYNGAYINSNYENKLNNMLIKLKQKYPLKNKKYFLAEEISPKQLTLFE